MPMSMLPTNAPRRLPNAADHDDDERRDQDLDVHAQIEAEHRTRRGAADGGEPDAEPEDDR